ncbi:MULTISPECIES: hypothetical protein [Streptomyces]|uniref:Integral membrane protein n=1 Tax=Streptomyces sanyensis TaxID=568869 RepID=A0ABP9A0R0_9ACTN
MAHYFAFGCFLLLGVAGSLAARTGYRGGVPDRANGYEVPARVASDPVLRARANGLVAFWCTGSALLSFAALVPLGRVVLRGGSGSLSTPGLVALALYGLVVVVVGAYPFERIKHLGVSAER